MDIAVGGMQSDSSQVVNSYRVIRCPVIDTLELDACSAAGSWERVNVTVGGDAHSTEEGVLGCIA